MAGARAGGCAARGDPAVPAAPGGAAARGGRTHACLRCVPGSGGAAAGLTGSAGAGVWGCVFGCCFVFSVESILCIPSPF